MFGSVNLPGVLTFNGRGGDVAPKEGDYTAEMVGAVPAGKALSDKEIEALGVVPADRTVNGKPLTGDVKLTAGDVGAVPAGQKLDAEAVEAMDAVPGDRTVNGRPLTEDIQLEAADVGAVAASDKGKPNGVASLDASGKVPEAQLPSLTPYVAGTSAPSDTKKLWIDTTANTGGLKYWNGSAWVPVPVCTS